MGWDVAWREQKGCPAARPHPAMSARSAGRWDGDRGKREGGGRLDKKEPPGTGVRAGEIIGMSRVRMAQSVNYES